MRIISKLRNILLTSLAVGLTLAPVVAMTPVAYADIDASKDAACAGIGLVNGDTDCNSNAEKRVGNVVTSIVNLLSLIVGAVAVIMIIVGGFRYVTSGGEAARVTAAKNTIIYAVIGLAIAALAQFIVHFVLTKVG